MVNKSKIFSDLSKIAVDAMSTFSGIKEEVETIVKLRIDKTLNKMNLVKRDEFEILKKIVQKMAKVKEKSNKSKNKKLAQSKIKKKKTRKKYKKRA